MTVELVVTTGDPQGIGPEVSVRGARLLLEREADARCVLVGDPAMLRELAGELPGVEVSGPGLRRLAVPHATAPASWGPPPSRGGGAAALRCLEAGLERVLGGAGRALVTAPLSKEAVSAGGLAFSGHTGWLAERFGAERAVMLFCAPGLKVALATVHLPLAAVPGALSPEVLQRTLEILDAGLRELFGTVRPRIAVLGLNPHAGEGGLLGREEIEVIAPAIAAFNAGGGRASGPHSADSFFRPARLEACDAVLAMYHDQGLLPVKALGFGRAVNLSLGLPIIRSSVDHGCAYDLAGRGEADPGSMVEALALARDLARREGRGRG